MVDRVINYDMEVINNLNHSTKTYASRLLYLLALQKPGTISQNDIANYLDCPVSTVKKITSILEKTGLLFHVELMFLRLKKLNHH